MKINENEQKVLRFLGSIGEDYASYFRIIAKNTDLDTKADRRACRSLARKGLAEFMCGLFDDDGMVAGSGYAATTEGRKLIDAQLL